MRSRDELRPAQRALIREFTEYESGVAVLGMGGGKTVSALTAFNDLRLAGKVKKMLVFAPPRSIPTAWGREAGRWEHLQGLKVAQLTGSPAQREKQLQWPASDDVHVFVLSLALIPWLVKVAAKLNLDWSETILHVDEPSVFKNPYSKRGKQLLRIRDEFAGVWGTTGTPRPNGYMDLFLPLKIVGGENVWGTKGLKPMFDPGVGRPLSEFEMWRRVNFYALDAKGYRWEPHAFQVPSLEHVAQTWMFRAPAADLGTPELHTGDDFVRWVYPSEEQEEHYQKMLKDLVTEAYKRGLKGEALLAWLVEACSTGVASGKLTQIVQGFLYVESQGKKDVHTFASNPKLDMLSDMNTELGADRAVIVYGYRAELDMLEKLFSDKRTGLLGGGVSAARANKTMEAWEAGEIDRLYLHPASAGHGVDGLQNGGHHLIWFHPTWSSEMYDQTIKRLDRPGQKHEVFNWQIAMVGTNDEIKLARVMRKLDEEAAFRERLRSIL